MSNIHRILVAAACGLSACVAHAGAVHVSLGADFSMPLLANGTVPLSLQFDVPDPAGPDVIAGPGFFVLANVAVSGSFDGTPFSNQTNYAGWFNYNFSGTQLVGIDVRLSSFVVADDMLQLVLSLPLAPFSGPSNAPVWTLGTWSGLGGTAAYYATGGGTTSATALGGLSQGTYSATVPEPATALLLPLALLCLAWTRPRRPVPRASHPV